MTDDQIEAAFQKIGVNLCAEEVTFTADTLADFESARSQYAEAGHIEDRTDKHLVVRGVQVRKGDKRKDLFVVDFGDRRAVSFG